MKGLLAAAAAAASCFVVGGAAASPAPGAEATQPGRPLVRFGIVVGHNAPERPGGTVLRYADDDAIEFFRLLSDAGVKTWLLTALDAESQALHPDLLGTKGARRADLDEVANEASAAIRDAAVRGLDTELLFFYSGHGNVEHGEGYVLLDDGRFSRGDLSQLLAATSATRNHVIVDACKAYYLVFDKGPGGERSRFPAGFAARATPGAASRGFVLSTSSDRDAHEWERFQAGVFSYEVRSALRGAADVNADGVITYAELGAFLDAANASVVNGRYRPDFAVWPPRGDAGGDARDALDAAVLRWENPQGVLDFDEAGVHVYLEDERGLRLLDAHPEEGLRLALHPPAQRPLFLRRADNSSERVIAEQGPCVASLLPSSAASIASKGALHIAFEQLFALPFRRTQVARFVDKAMVVPAVTVSVEAQPDMVQPEAVQPWRDRLRRASGYAGLAFAAGGAGMNAWALERYYNGRHGSQAERVELNGTVEKLNVAAVISYAVAAALGSTWLTLTLLDDAPAAQGDGALE